MYLSMRAFRLLTRHSVPMDQTTIKTLYIFVEIAIDAAHLAQTVRINFPGDRLRFHAELLDSEESDISIPAGQKIGQSRHLQIEGPNNSSKETHILSQSDVDKGASSKPTRLALVSTIQFVAALSRLKDDLTVEYTDPTPFITPAGLIGHSAASSSSELEVKQPMLYTGRYDAIIPRSKPLSPGEILGCTAPRLSDDVDALM